MPDDLGLTRVTVSADGEGEAQAWGFDAGALGARAFGADDLFLVNSTSGTTGLPKCVMHNQNRWMFFHQLAADAGRFTGDDVFFSALPAPFGFGLWTSHVTPAVLGCTTVVQERFDADAALRAIEREKVTVLGCVSTQFLMMLNSPELTQRDLSSLRCMFTGGEAVPYERAARFEDVTGARVLQFYGSNETGALSRTTIDDDREHRLSTAGRVIPEMHVRLLDDDGRDITEPGVPGNPVCKGPATCFGYLDDEQANEELFTSDGWMRIGDVAEIDADGYLRVVGRTSDIIIRGGKNLSAPAIEAEVAEHPAIAVAAAVAMPDEVFGERVCLYAELRPDTSLELADVVEFLTERGVSREWFPERLVVLDALPRASGGKVAKGELRAAGPVALERYMGFQTGSRFSRNASPASAMLPVNVPSTCVRFSSSIAARRLDASRLAQRPSFVMYTPYSLFAITPAARSRAASSNSSRGTNRFSMPKRSASSAEKRRPVSINSAARVAPTMRGSR